MSRLNSHRLIAVLAIVFIGWGQADARPVRVGQLPNGSALGCASCHVNPSGGGPLTPFGSDINSNYLTQPGRNGQVVWNAMLAMLDSDGDGVSNGRELGDPDGDGMTDASIPVTNPGDPNSFMQMPPSGGAPSATSVVIGGVTIAEAMMSNMMGAVVPSGMQPIEITFDQPLIVTLDTVEGIAIENVEILIFPLTLLATATDLSVSEDRLKVTATLNLSADETYQMIIRGSGEMAMLNDIQQYFFGTVALPDAAVSGTAVLPQGVQISKPGQAVLFNPDALAALLAAAGDDGDEDLFALALSAIVRLSPLSPAESLPEQLMFALQHVPDGSYVLSLSQDVVDGDGNVVTMSHFSGINPFTGGVHPATLIQVVNGASVTDLQIVLQTDPEPIDIREISVQSVNAENNSFFIQRDGQQVSVDVSQALMITLDLKSVEDVISIFGNSDDFAQLKFSISDLMVGDTVSILGFPISETAIQALLVIRQAPVQTRSADLNGDGGVDFSDFLLFAAAFGTSEGGPGYNVAADLDGDGTVAFSDFLIFASAFGKPVG